MARKYYTMVDGTLKVKKDRPVKQYVVYSGELLWDTFTTQQEAQACIAYNVRYYGRMNMHIVTV